MKISNNIPITEYEDIINVFTKNLRKKRKEKLMKGKKSRNLPNLNRETMWYMRITDLEFIRGLRKSK